MSIPQTTLSTNKEVLIYEEKKLVHIEWFGPVHAF